MGEGQGVAQRRGLYGPLGSAAKVQEAAPAADNRRMEIRIRRGRCCGSAQCAETLPQVFALDDAGKAVVLDPDAASFDLLLESAAGCPCQAIELEDDEGAQFP